MKKYGKIICGALRVPQNYPCAIVVDGVRITNPTEEQYIAAGYLPIDEKTPSRKDGKVAIASYKVSKDGSKIIQSWSYVAEPEITPNENGE